MQLDKLILFQLPRPG
ncbi:hypothetical protein AYI69_g6897, partial [Smittium culicis]